MKTDDNPPNSWYTRLGDFEPLKIAIALDLDMLEGSALKYLLRWRHKNGLEDLKKLRFFAQQLIDREQAKTQVRDKLGPAVLRPCDDDSGKVVFLDEEGKTISRDAFNVLREQAGLPHWTPEEVEGSFDYGLC